MKIAIALFASVLLGAATLASAYTHDEYKREAKSSGLAAADQLLTFRESNPFSSSYKTVTAAKVRTWCSEQDTFHVARRATVGSFVADTSVKVPAGGFIIGTDTTTLSGVEVNYNDNTHAIRNTSPSRLIAFTTTIQVVNTNATVFTLAGPGFAGHVEKIVVAPGATLPADAGGVTLAFTKTGATLLTAASTVDLTSGGQAASTAHAEALNATAANNDVTATNVVIATLATDGTVTTVGSPILITVWYSLDNP